MGFSTTSMSRGLQGQLLFGIGQGSVERDQRALQLALESIQDTSEVILMHVMVLPVGQLSIVESQETRVRRHIERHFLPILAEHQVQHQIIVRHAASTPFLHQPNSYYISHTLAREALRLNVSALVVGGSGNQGCFRRYVLGSRISARLTELNTAPLVLVGSQGVKSELPDHQPSTFAAAAA